MGFQGWGSDWTYEFPETPENPRLQLFHLHDLRRLPKIIQYFKYGWPASAAYKNPFSQTCAKSSLTACACELNKQKSKDIYKQV